MVLIDSIIGQYLKVVGCPGDSSCRPKNRDRKKYYAKGKPLAAAGMLLRI
jgi:hypothetical protein